MVLHQKRLKSKLGKNSLNKKRKIDDDIKPMLEKEVLLPDDRARVIKELRKEMQAAAKTMDFETAALLRDKIRFLQQG
jgi:excinuclease UvrABC helicase subunit UvrB